MESKLFENLTIDQRVEMLEANADTFEEMTYHKPLDPEEVAKIQGEYVQLAIEIAAKEDELKEIKQQFKETIDPMKEEMKDKLQQVKARSKEVRETVYMMKDFEEGMLGVYNDRGELISSRRLTPDEKQLSMGKTFRIAANE